MFFFSCLVYRFAFDFNPALQPRSLVVLGCICKVANDRLIRGVLEVLIMVGICVVLVYVKWPGLIFVNTSIEKTEVHKVVFSLLDLFLYQFFDTLKV